MNTIMLCYCGKCINFQKKNITFVGNFIPL